MKSFSRTKDLIDAWIGITAHDDAYWRRSRTPRYFPHINRKLPPVTDLTEDQKALYYKAYDSVLETEKKQYRAGA